MRLGGRLRACCKLDWEVEDWADDDELLADVSDDVREGGATVLGTSKVHSSLRWAPCVEVGS